MENQTQNGSVEVTVIPNAAQTSLFLITKAEIDTQIATAKAFPRSIKEFMDKAESIATVNEDVAASCNYALPRGGKTIEGPSVRFAEIIISAYGNTRSGARVIDNDGKTITAQGICHDLETNNCMTVEVKKSILQNEFINGQKTGRKIPMNEDMQVVVGNAACAIAFRNAVYKVIPAALVEGIYEKTKEVAKGKAETMVKRRDKALDYAKSLNISNEQICAVLGIKKVEDIDLDKLALFRGILTAIKNGESTVDEVFRKEVVSEDANPKRDRIEKLIRNAKNMDELNKHRKAAGENDLLDLFLERENELTAAQ